MTQRYDVRQICASVVLALACPSVAFGATLLPELVPHRGLARRIEQISKDVLQLNQGTLYPALLRMQQEGWIASRWGASEKNRKARFYSITKAGRRRLAKETEDWRRMSSTIERFLGFDPGSLAEERG